MFYLILTAILPIFIIMSLGIISTKLKNFPENTDTALNNYVFYFALPLLLFASMATTPIQTVLNWQFMLVFFLAMVILFILGLVIYWRKYPPAERIILALSIASPNMAYMGIPILMILLGSKVLVPVSLATILFCLIMAVGVVTIEFCHAGLSFRQIIKNGLMSLIKNPLIVAPMLGIIWTALHIPTPRILTYICHLVGDTAAPCALFAIGVTLKQRPVKYRWGFLSVASVIKLVLQPLLVLGLLYLIPLQPFWAVSAFVLAGLPTLMVCYILAQQFDANKETVASLILVSTLASIVTLSVIIISLPYLWPGVHFG